MQKKTIVHFGKTLLPSQECMQPLSLGGGRGGGSDQRLTLLCHGKVSLDELVHEPSNQARQGVGRPVGVRDKPRQGGPVLAFFVRKVLDVAYKQARYNRVSEAKLVVCGGGGKGRRGCVKQDLAAKTP